MLSSRICTWTIYEVSAKLQDTVTGDFSPVIVRVVASVTVYICVPYVNIVEDGQTVVRMSVVRVVYCAVVETSGTGVTTGTEYVQGQSWYYQP